jgi:hypothetical protein
MLLILFAFAAPARGAQQREAPRSRPCAGIEQLLNFGSAILSDP